MVLILQAFPVFVLAPILVLWLGFGLASKVAMTTIIIFFPVASAFADGLRRTDQEILDAVSLEGANHWQTLVSMRVPLAVPSLVSGLRVAAPLAPLGAVVGEWVGASGGLGFVMVQANARMQTDTVFAAMTILAILTLILRLLIDWLTAGLAPWASEADPSSSSASGSSVRS
jgi:putative hydroxymethylpyrimidine transport system permease protein